MDCAFDYVAFDAVTFDVCVPVPPTPPTPPVVVEARRNPGPPIFVYQDPEPIPHWKRKRENEEIIIL